MRPADIASIMVLLGLGAQGWGLYAIHGLGLTLLVVGTEIAAMGLAGVLRRA